MKALASFSGNNKEFKRWLKARKFDFAVRGVKDEKR